MSFPLETSPWLTIERAKELLHRTITHAATQWERKDQRILLVLPERQRLLSGMAGLANTAYEQLVAAGWSVTVALVHFPGEQPWRAQQLHHCLPAIPATAFWNAEQLSNSVVVGNVPGEVVAQHCGGLINTPLPLSLPSALVNERWAGVLNLEWVAPHDLLGFSGAPQNLWLGLGNQQTRAVASQIGATLGDENNVANLVAPLRQTLFWADQQCWQFAPRVDVMLVGGLDLQGHPALIGFYAGNDQTPYLQAALLSRQRNVTIVDEPLQRMVVLLDGTRYNHLWDMQQLIPRLRMALADGGQLILIAPGLEQITSTVALSELILSQGYVGSTELLQRAALDPRLASENWCLTHLRHGSQHGRCQIYYATTGLTDQILLQLSLRPMEMDEALIRFKPQHARSGWNFTIDGERFYFIRDPAFGLWSTAARLQNRLHEFARRTMGRY